MFEQELRRIEIFRDLSDRELDPLLEFFDEISLPANHVIFRQGELAEAFYVIKEGGVVIFRDDGDREPVQLLARLGAGDHFGEFGIYDEFIRSASVRTSEPCQILRIGKQDLLTVLVEHPTVALRLQTAAAHHHDTTQVSSPTQASGLANRREVRTIIDREVVLMVEEGTSMKVRLLNLSRGGLCFRGVPAGWEVGRGVRFHLGLGTGMLQLSGEISWIRSDAVGVIFIQRSRGHYMKIQWALRQLVGQQRAALGQVASQWMGTSPIEGAFVSTTP